MSWLPADLPAILLIVFLFFSIIGLGEWISRTYQPAPELTRKFIHLGGGIVCLLFPYLLRSHWSVLLMAVGMATFFLFGSYSNILSSLNRVSRKTRGSEYYPFAVWMVFYLSQSAPWLYISSLLVLAVADAGAALVGTRYGRIHYTVDHETKSVEGSFFFFLLAFLAVELPLILLGPIPAPNAVLSAVLVSTLVTAIEAVTRKGRDNLFVPLAVCLILNKITQKPMAEIVYQSLSLAALTTAVSLVLWRSRRFNTGGATIFILFIYAAWSLGSEVWALPVLMTFILQIALSEPADTASRSDSQRIRVAESFSALALPMSILIAANGFDAYNFCYAPFVLSICAAFCLLAPAADQNTLKFALIGAALPWLFQSNWSVLSLISLLGLTALAWKLRSCMTNPRRQPLITAAVAGIMATLQWAGISSLEPATKSLLLSGFFP